MTAYWDSSAPVLAPVSGRTIAGGAYPKVCVWVGFIVYRFSVAAGGEINRSPNFNAN